VTPANPSARDGRNRRLELEYDYMGRRIRKVAYAWDDVAEDWETTPDMDLRFVYDGWNLVQEIDGLVEVESGVTDVAREYTWGLDLSGQSGNPSPAGIHGAGGIGGLLGTHWTGNTTSTSDDKAYIYFYDANGNVGQMIDVVSGTNYGTIAAKYEYYPFGGLLLADGVAAEANPFRFSTKYRDNETGSYYYGYRYLRTKHGRWLSRDPIGEKDDPNVMRFAVNAPSNYVDFLGLKKCTPRVLQSVLVIRYSGGLGHEFLNIGTEFRGFYPDSDKAELFTSNGKWVNEASELDPKTKQPRLGPLMAAGKYHAWEVKTKCSGMLRHGSLGKNTPCDCATDDQILTCLLAFTHPGKRDYAFCAVFGNCRDNVQRALSECCLQRGKKARNPTSSAGDAGTTRK